MTNKTEVIQKNNIAQNIIGEHESQKQRVSIADEYVLTAPTPKIDISHDDEEDVVKAATPI